MSRILFDNACFTADSGLEVCISSLELKDRDLLVLLGSNGSGKTLIAKTLAGRFRKTGGTAPEGITPALVSFEDQQQLFEDDYRLRNNDALRPEEEHGITVSSLFEGIGGEARKRVFETLRISELIGKSIGQLSGGEGRRVLIAQALCRRPDLLVLDTPFDSLDVDMRADLQKVIHDIHSNFDAVVVLIVNRASEIPESANLLGIISSLAIAKIGPRDEMLRDPEVHSLLYCENLSRTDPPAPLFEMARFGKGSFVCLKHINITYDRPIFKDFSLTLEQGEHCLITGPNGAGKSTLLSLITGDNPLVYQNDVTVFGHRRGSGESIWDVKKNIGLVSGALHLDYRVSSPVINVIVSGFYDSIGLYRKCGDKELETARRWLGIIGMEQLEHQSFRQLSFGQQRLVLIARSLVKCPPLLILDEPMQGLDALGRALIKNYAGYFMQKTETTVIFVSHHEEDAPEGFAYHIDFVPRGDGTYDIVKTQLRGR